MTRNEQLQAMVDLKGLGLEIGPSHSPVFPKRDGFNVETLDYASADDLRIKYQGAGVDLDAIEEVDYVSDGRPLHEVVQRDHAYDYIFSSHAIEHVTDFIAYIKSCERLLKPDGVIALAVPDKRYTFDVIRPVSTTGQVLEAHSRGQSRHAPAAIFDFIVDTTTLSGRPVWTKIDTGSLEFANTIGSGKSLFDDAVRPDAPYHDVHGWVFTPSSFRLIIDDLQKLGIINVGEAYMAEMGCLEFHVVLRAGAAGHGLDRATLSRRVVYDQVTCGAQVLAADYTEMRDVHTLLRAAAD